MGQTTATRQRIFKNVIWSKLLNIRSDTHEKLYKGSPKRLPQDRRLHHPMQGDEDDDGMATRITWLLLLLLLGSVAAASATVGTSEALDALPM